LENWGSCVESISFSTDLYNLSNDNIKTLFLPDNSYTKRWDVNNCDINNITIDTSTFVPWDINSLTLSSNTIYKVENWTYNFIWDSSLDWAINIPKGSTCIALIWENSDNVIFTSSFTSWWIKYNKALLNYDRWNTTIWYNFIYYNLSLDWNKSSSNRMNEWIRLFRWNTSTLNKIKIYNFSWDGLYILWDYYTWFNIDSYNNNRWLSIYDWKYNLFNNIKVFNNRKNIALLWNSSKHTFNNVLTFNSDNWIELSNWNSTYNLLFNNINIFNNLSWYKLTDWNYNYSSEINYFNNYNLYWNNEWIYITDWKLIRYWNWKIFWNIVNWTWTNLNDSISSLWTDWLWSIWFSNWSNDFSWTMSCAYHVQPLWMNLWSNCSLSWRIELENTINSFTYWSNIPFQKQPVWYNNSINEFENYFNDWTDYFSNKKIWEW